MCPEVIIDGRGTGSTLKINPDGSVNIAGTITSTTGSESFLFGRSGGIWAPLAVVSGTEAILRTDTIMSAGSVVIITDPVPISGTVTIAGSIIIGSVTANVDSIYIQSGDNVNLGTTWTGIGSTLITNNVTVIQDSSVRQVSAGSIIVTNTVDVLGSVNINNTVTTDINNPETIGSIAVQTVDATNLDIRDLTNVSDSVAAFIDSPATIGSYTTQTIDGTVTVNNLSTAGSLSVQTVNGSVVDLQTIPTDSSKNNPTWKFEYDGDGNVGSITQTIGAGSYVQVFTWANGSVLTDITAWV